MKVAFHRNFEKKYVKLPDKIKQAFLKRLAIFTKDPFNSILGNHSVENVFPECRSINITGDYRAIFRQENHAAIFLMIGRHAELYK